MTSKFQSITELYRRTVTALTGDYDHWTGFLRAACYNYKCPFDEQVLIYAQRPQATAVLELVRWNRQFGRWVNTGAAGIAVIDEQRGKGRLKYYFDIADTHATPRSRPVPLWQMDSGCTQRVIETLEATFGTLAEKGTLPEAVLSASRNAVADNFQDYLRELQSCRRGSMLEEMDELNVEVTYRRALESSVAYMLLTRLSLPAETYILPEDFQGVYAFDTPDTVNALGIATSDIAEMGLREISRTVLQSQREPFFAKDSETEYDAVKEQRRDNEERSDDYGNDVQDAGERPLAEPAAADGAGSSLGQVRGAETAVSDGAPPRAVHQSQDQRPPDGAFGGDGTGGTADDRTDRDADGQSGERDGGAERSRSAPLGGADERHPPQRGGDGTAGADLPLTEAGEGAGSEELPAPLPVSTEQDAADEQIALSGMGGAYEVPEEQRGAELFPVQSVPQEVIDQTLYTAGNGSGSAYRVAVFYTRQWPEADCAAFLRREFGTDNGRGIEYDGHRYAVWFTEDGIQLAEGDSVRTGRCRTTVTWEQASARILELLEAGTYLSASEWEQAQTHTLGEAVEDMILLARDSSETARQQGYFTHTLAACGQHGGFTEWEDALAAFAQEDGGLASLAEEYHTFLAAYQQDKRLLRFRLPDSSRHCIGVVLDGLHLPQRRFPTQPDFLRRCQMLITQDEIDQLFLGESINQRLAVYAHFCYPHTKEERQKFIKQHFGEYSGTSFRGYDQVKSHKGLTFRREYDGKRYGEVRLTIPQVVNTYQRLILQQRFPDEAAIVDIPRYEREQLARVVHRAFYDAPEGILRPYPANTDYLDAVKIIAQQLPEAAKAAEMLDGVTARLEGLQEGDRYFSACQKAKEQLTAYLDGTFSLFHHKHDGAQPESAQESDEPEEKDESVALPPGLVQARERAGAAEPLAPEGVNYRITDDALGAAPPSQRFQNNMAAIQLLKQLETENRTATAEEQSVLAKYVGWGGLADGFDPKHSRYGELKALLTDEEYAAARESVLTAFYTPPVVIRSIYDALEQMGFRTGNVLEPSCGVGHFLGMLPEAMASSRVYGVELDDISGRIAKRLYPRSSITVGGYETMDFPDNFFDVAVGNVPFGQFKVSDRRYDRLNLPIHEYFFAKTLDKVRPGGVVAFVTSAYTLDKRTANVRRYIVQRAELLGAIRLPNDTFKAAAGTEVVSDILFLQKRDRLVDMEPDWVQTETTPEGFPLNRHFLQHPDMVLGELKPVSGPYGSTLTCAPFPDRSLDSLLANAVQNIHGQITAYERGEEWEGEDTSLAADPAVRNFSYTLVNGKLYYRENSRMNPVEVSKTAESRIRGMIELRDCVRTLLTYQTEDYPDADIRAQQAKLNDLYDRFTREYGLINSRGNAIAFEQDSAYFLLCSLEVLDEDGGLRRKADLFTKRTIRSHHPAQRVDTAAEALALSIGEKARVDMGYMTQLTGRDEATLAADLQGVVFLNPEGGEKYLPADEYLSGNVRRKLALAKAKATIDPQYQPNVEALTAVQPIDLTAAEISVRLGAVWLEPAYIRQFIFETLGTPRSAQWYIKVYYSHVTGEWHIEGKSKDKNNVKAFNTYGTLRVSAYEIIESSLNLKDVRVFDYQYDETGRRVAVLNKKETAVAQSKQELLKEAFSEWIWKDPRRRESVCRTYNELFNSNRPGSMTAATSISAA